MGSIVCRQLDEIETVSTALRVCGHSLHGDEPPAIVIVVVNAPFHYREMSKRPERAGPERARLGLEPR